MEKKKELGQVFTPVWVVELILDRIGYDAESGILDKKLLEPSCGDGVFLIAAARRLVEAGKLAGYTSQQISSALGDNLWGVEYDPEAVEATLDNLKAFALENNLPPVKWNIHTHDALTFGHYSEFDFVVGNPPYIRIHNMTPDLRKSVKEFSMSTGTTDLYIIFYELGLQWLNETGVLGYIAPNSWMKNSSQKSFRAKIIGGKELREIINYGSRPIFGKEAATYTAVVILDKSGEAENITYVENGDGAQWENEIPYATFSDYAGEPLTFASKDDTLFMSGRSEYATLGSMCVVQNGIATLRDKVFLGAPSNSEEGSLSPVVKISTYKGGTIEKSIFFPYKQQGDKVLGLTEKDIQGYPNLYAYLLSHKADLLTRDSDKTAEWFHYGRSQGLNKMMLRKLVFSHVISSDQTTIKAFILPADTVVYSGLFITEQEDGLTLEKVKEVIESPEFCRYMKLTGKDISGNYKTVGGKNVKGFPVQLSSRP